MDEYDIETAYATDPVGTINAVIAEAASIARQAAAAITGSQHAAELQRLRESQSRVGSSYCHRRDRGEGRR